MLERYIKTAIGNNLQRDYKFELTSALLAKQLQVEFARRLAFQSYCSLAIAFSSARSKFITGALREDKRQLVSNLDRVLFSCRKLIQVHSSCHQLGLSKS